MFSKFLSVALFATWAARAVQLHTHNSSFIPDEILRVTAQNVTLGCLQRYSVVINGSHPGPELRFTESSKKWIRVFNDMTDKNLTMHWHGLSLAAYPFSDGTPQASQWPIPPLHYFDYELSFGKGQAGTYFYHSHVDFQAVSASGPLIIEEEDGKSPYKYDDERMIYLSDVFNKTDSTIFNGLTNATFAWSGETNGVLINGLGQANTLTPQQAASCPIANISVDPGKTYRVRFTGATALSLSALAIEGHNTLDVIEADGAYTKPVNTSFMQVGPGQRFSTLLKTKTCKELEAEGKSDFWIQLETRERPTQYRGYGLLSYTDCPSSNTTISNATSTIPTTPPFILPNITLGWLDYQLHPLTPNNFPSLSAVTRRVTITVQQIINGTITWHQNGLPWTEYFPKTPYLVDLYENNKTGLPNYEEAVRNGGMDNRTRAFPAKIGEVLEIVLVNEAATGTFSGGFDTHPFHAHGAHIYDIGSGNGTYDAEANENKLQKMGGTPVKRDTTILYRYANAIVGNVTVGNEKQGWRAWRLRVTEPGVWMIHCHTLQHMIMGMQTVWVMGDTKDILRLPKPQVEGYLTYGGGAYGNVTHDPEMIHWEEVA